jgi:hypothetical protein
VDELEEADAVITLRSYYRKRPKPIADAERYGIPIYVIRSNTISKMEDCLTSIFGIEAEDSFAMAMREAKDAISRVLSGIRSVELSPQNAYIRRLQHQMASEANLSSKSYGKEPRRRVRIFRG